MSLDDTCGITDAVAVVDAFSLLTAAAASAALVSKSIGLEMRLTVLDDAAAG